MLLLKKKKIVSPIIALLLASLFLIIVHTAYAASDEDSDGDGLATQDEISLYHTDPNHVDTDGDGLTDSEEVFEYGTDPLIFTTNIFSESEKKEGKIRIQSPSNNALLHGNEIYIEGVSSEKNAAPSLDLELLGDELQHVQIHIETDARGVFHSVVSLEKYCHLQHANTEDVNFMWKNEIVKSVTIDCDASFASPLIRHMTFGGVDIGSYNYAQPLVITHEKDLVFSAVLRQQTLLEAHFSSVVFSSSLLANLDEKSVLLRPSEILTPGKHMLVIVLKDLRTNEYDPPIEIPFRYEPTGVLGADISLTSITLFPILFVTGISILMIRRIRRKSTKYTILNKAL